jgi:hypothetical protein
MANRSHGGSLILPTHCLFLSPGKNFIAWLPQDGYFEIGIQDRLHAKYQR